jgi:hypothetical protein
MMKNCVYREKRIDSGIQRALNSNDGDEVSRLKDGMRE